jgi:hypothetical protein
MESPHDGIAQSATGFALQAQLFLSKENRMKKITVPLFGAVLLCCTGFALTGATKAMAQSREGCPVYDSGGNTIGCNCDSCSSSSPCGCDVQNPE